MNLEQVNAFLERIPHAFAEDDPHSDQKSLEQSNIAALLAVYNAVKDGDFQTLYNAFTFDVTLENIGSPDLNMIGSWSGRDAVLEATANNYAQVKNQIPTLHRIVAQGDMVVVFAEETGTHTATQKTYTSHWVQQFTFQEGKIARIWQIGYVSAMEPITSAR